MILERLAVAGFGALPAGLALDFASGLNLVLAPNEGGKTTLAELIAGLFYGYGSRKAGVHPFEPWAGGETGAELAYRLADGRRFSLSRHLLARSERLLLRGPDGGEIDLAGAAPGEVHLGLSRGVFLTVVSLNLDDLAKAVSGASGKELKHARDFLRGYFFNEAATRGELANPMTVLEDWTQRRETLYSKDRRKGKEGSRLKEEIDAAREALAQAEDNEAQAQSAQRELDGIKARREKLDAKREEARARLAQAQKALHRAQEAKRRDELVARLADLEKQGLAGAEVEERAKDLEREARASRERGAALAAKAKEAAGLASQGLAAEDPEQAQAELEAMADEQAGLALRARQLESEEQGDKTREVELISRWGKPLAELAGLDSGLPFRLESLRNETTRACEAEAGARERLDGLRPTPPAPVWLLGLALVLAAVGVRVFLWGYFSEILWPLITGIALSLAGLGVAGWWGIRRKAKTAWLREEQESRQALERTQETLAGLEARLAEALSPLGEAGQDADPGELSAALGEARELGARTQRRAGERRELETAQTDLAGRLAGMGLPADGPLDQALRRARDLVRKQREARKEADSLAAQAKAEQERATQFQSALADYLKTQGLADMQALAQARERARQAQAIKEALDQLAEPEAGEAAPLLSLGEAEADIGQIQAGLRGLEAELGELGQAQGGLEEKLSRLARAQSAAQAAAGLEMLKARRAEVVHQHDALLLAGALLTKAMEKFRLEAQPSLLKRAGEYLAAASAGAYQWLGTDLFAPKAAQEPELRTRAGEGGAERGAGLLSRGAREQLYLSLRLALADEITAGGEDLPLILDDPLVNFDDARQAESLALVARLAQRRQVLYLTCHQRQAERLAELGPVRELSLSAG